MNQYFDDLFWLAIIGLVLTPLAIMAVKVVKKKNSRGAIVFCGVLVVLLSLYFFAHTAAASIGRTNREVGLMALGSLGVLIVGLLLVILPMRKRK